MLNPFKDQPLKDQLGTKFISSSLLLVILIFGLIIGVYLVNQRQIFRSKASQNGEVRIVHTGETSSENTVSSNPVELEIIPPDWDSQSQSSTSIISKVYAQEEDQEVEQTFPDESSEPVVLVEVTDKIKISLDPQAVALDGECIDYLDPNYYCLEISYPELVEKNNRLKWFLPSLEGEYTIYIGFISSKDNLKQTSVQLNYKKLVPENSETVSSDIECGCIEGENICNIHCAGYGTTGSQCSEQKDCTVRVSVPSGYNEKTSHLPSVVAIAGQALTSTLIPALRQLPGVASFNAGYEFFSRPSGGEGYILTINQARTVGLDLEVVYDPLTGGRAIILNPVQLKEMNVEIRYFPEVDPETGEERIEVIKLYNLARPIGEQSAEVFANTLFGETIGRLVGKGVKIGYNKVFKRKPALLATDSYGEIIMPERLPEASLPKTDPVPRQPNDAIEYPGQIEEALSRLRQSLDEAKEVQIDYRAAVNKLRPTIGGSFDVLPEEKIFDFQKKIIQNTGLDTAIEYKVKIVRPGDDLFDEKEIEVKLLKKLAESSPADPVVLFEQLVQRHKNLGTFNETIDSRADIFRKIAIAEGMELDGKLPGFTLTVPEDRQIIYYSVNYDDVVDLARAYAEKRGERVFIESIEQAKNYLGDLAEESFYHEVGHIVYDNFPQASKNSWREYIERAGNAQLMEKVIQIQKDKYGGRIDDIPIDDEAFADFFVNFASGGSRISRLGISSEATLLVKRLIKGVEEPLVYLGQLRIFVEEGRMTPELIDFWRGLVRDADGSLSKSIKIESLYSMPDSQIDQLLYATFRHGVQSSPDLSNNSVREYITKNIDTSTAFLKGLEQGKANQSADEFRSWLQDLHKKLFYKTGNPYSGPGVLAQYPHRSDYTEIALYMAEVAARYGDPLYNKQGVSVLKIGESYLILPEVKAEAWGTNSFHGTKNSGFRFFHKFPPREYLPDYYQVMQKKLVEFQQLSHGASQEEAVKIIAEFYQYAINTHMFVEVNHSLFMNMVNTMLIQRGLKPIQQGVIDYAAYMLQPEGFDRYFLDQVRRVNPSLD